LILVILFAFIFSWGIFILLSLFLPVYISAPIAVVAGTIWYFKPIIWLQNILLLLALVSVGLVFGYLLAPWTAMLFLVIIAVYDAVSVRLGHMMWMAEKLSESNVLPAFVIPRTNPNWNQNLKNTGFKRLFEGKAEREFSLLGGGDIGFPLLLAVSVYFSYGYTGAIIIAAFSVIGLIGAYWVQAFFLKGKPTPALPPIACASLIGFLIVYFLL
jgi:presenilin-like A22 family membrane protease